MDFQGGDDSSKISILLGHRVPKVINYEYLSDLNSRVGNDGMFLCFIYHKMIELNTESFIDSIFGEISNEDDLKNFERRFNLRLFCFLVEFFLYKYKNVDIQIIDIIFDTFIDSIILDKSQLESQKACIFLASTHCINSVNNSRLC